MEKLEFLLLMSGIDTTTTKMSLNCFYFILFLVVVASIKEI